MCLHLFVLLTELASPAGFASVLLSAPLFPIIKKEMYLLTHRPFNYNIHILYRLEVLYHNNAHQTLVPTCARVRTRSYMQVLAQLLHPAFFAMARTHTDISPCKSSTGRWPLLSHAKLLCSSLSFHRYVAAYELLTPMLPSRCRCDHTQ